MATNTPHIAQDIFDYNRNKLCGIYDSSIVAEGQAHDIVFLNELTGYKKITFNLPYVVKEKRNFRWNYIRSEYLLRLVIDDYVDWFIIHAPTRRRDAKSLSTEVLCDHISTALKTKNIYMTFDDENGIGTLRYLLEQVLKGTGWKIGTCDIFYERLADGTDDTNQEKIRSLKSEAKIGAYQLITNICNLFGGYPIYDGDAKTVSVRALNNKLPMIEFTVGKDIESLAVTYNTNDIITRLYVEGEYGEDGYVGIDDVEENEHGLSYLMNFDYYKELGLFTKEHEQALNQYYVDIKAANEVIRGIVEQLGRKENRLNEIWGQCSYAIYDISEYNNNLVALGGMATEKDAVIEEGDEIYVVNVTAQDVPSYTIHTAPYEKVPFDSYIVKFIGSLPSGKLGGIQSGIEGKEKMRAKKYKEHQEASSDAERNRIEEQIVELNAAILELQEGREATDSDPGSVGAFDLMYEAILISKEAYVQTQQRTEAMNAQNTIEVDFAVAMGELLKEGYWNNSNYALGQEKYLYADALEMMEQLSKPAVTYSVSLVSLANQFKYKPGYADINMKARIYDPELQINDIVYVSSVTRYLDRPQDDSIELSNKDIALQGLTLDSILSRMTQLADLIDQKNSLYNRTTAINNDGSIYLTRLEGQINILKNGLSSTMSSWYTDERGNIIFENSNGRSAMMLTGEGFMIANGKVNGEWNWRTFGTGEGFTADAIVTGFLSADRIESNSITVSHLSANIGEELEQTSNIGISQTVSKAVEDSKEAILKSTESMIKQSGDKIISQIESDESIGGEISRLSSILSQTSKDFTIEFKKLEDGLEKYKEEVKTYIRFSEDGLELGKNDDSIKAKLTNDQLSFMQGDSTVAYISDNKLNITEAEITTKLLIGRKKNDPVFFEWVKVDGGLGLKLRDGSITT